MESRFEVSFHRMRGAVRETLHSIEVRARDRDSAAAAAIAWFCRAANVAHWHLRADGYEVSALDRFELDLA